MGDPEEREPPQAKPAKPIEPFYLALAQTRSARGQIGNCPAPLLELCVKSLLQHLKKFDSLAADPVLSSRRNQQLLENLPSTLVQRILDLIAVVHDFGEKHPSLWMILVFVSKNTDYLDFCNLPLLRFDMDHSHGNNPALDSRSQPVMEMLPELRLKGIDKLKTLLLPFWWKISRLPVRAEHLVPNERLVHLKMMQMICTDEDLAVLANNFPNLQDVTVRFGETVSRSGIYHLSKLQKLHSFKFIIDGYLSELADDLLIHILQSMPRLKRAGRCSNFRSNFSFFDMSHALNACSEPLSLTHVNVDSSKFKKNLSQLVPGLTSLKVSLQGEGAVQDFFGLSKLHHLFFVNIGQENFDALINHYGKNVRKLRVGDVLNLDSAAQMCPNLESLECGIECTLSRPFRDNPWPLLTEFISHRQKLDIDLAYWPNSLQFNSVRFVEKLSFCNSSSTTIDLQKLLDKFTGRFDNLVEASLVLYPAFDKKDSMTLLRKFLTACPKLAKLNLNADIIKEGYLERQMYKIPGLHLHSDI